MIPEVRFYDGDGKLTNVISSETLTARFQKNYIEFNLKKVHDRLRTRQRKYELTHKKKLKAYRKRYRQENKERIASQKKEYRLLHKEEEKIKRKARHERKRASRN